LPRIEALVNAYGDDANIVVLVTARLPNAEPADFMPELKEAKRDYRVLIDGATGRPDTSLAGQTPVSLGSWWVINSDGVLEAVGGPLEKASTALSKSTGKPRPELPEVASPWVPSTSTEGAGQVRTRAPKSSEESDDEAATSALTSKDEEHSRDSGASQATGDTAVSGTEETIAADD